MKTKETTVTQEQAERFACETPGMTIGEAYLYLYALKAISDINSSIVDVGYSPRDGVKYYYDNKGGH